MVTVDDATYVKMRDNLYWGNEAQASKAKAKIESSYTDEQYNKFVSWLWQVPTQQATPVNQPTETTQTPTQTPIATPVKEETVVKQEETVGSTVPEIKQEWALKPQTQEYYNQDSAEAQSKIIANLNNYKQTNPEYFTNYEDFKKNFSYNARNDVQKNLLDTWYKGYEQSLQLSATPVTDLYTQYKDGQISTAQLESLRVSNPEKYAELQTQINKWNIIAAYDDDTAPTTMNFQEMAYQMMAQALNKMSSWDYGTSWIFQEYEEKMNSPEMLELSDQTTEIEENIKDIQDDIDRMKEEVEREFEGTWATRSKINAIIADRTYDLQLQLRTLNNEYTKYATQYNNRANQYQNEFQLQLQEYQLNMQARNQQMSELWFAMDLMNFETNEQKAQREWDYWVKQQEYTNWNINSSDYQTRYKAALSSVQNLLSQYEWIPMQRSAEQMAEDILKNMEANWTTLGEELSTINKQIQGKKEYKILYNNTYGNKNVSTASSDLKTYKIWDKEYVLYNGQLISADEFNSMYSWSVWWNAKPYTIISEDMYSLIPGKWGLWAFLMDSKNANGKKWGQCAKFVNDYLEQIWVWRYFGTESAAERANWCNSDTPKVWTVAVFDYNHYTDGKNYGHVAIVTQVYDDWSFKVKESNYPSWETIWTRIIKPWDAALKWFIDFSKWAVSVSDNSNATLQELNSNISAQDQQKAEGMLKQIKTWNMTPSETSNARDWLIENGYGDQFLEALDKWIKVSLTDTQQDFYEYWMNNYKTSDIVKDFKTAASQINNLITSLDANNWAWDLAGIFQFMKVLDPNSVVREQEFKNAASAAGYAKPSELWQKYVKHGWDWTWLSDAQRGNFKELAKNLIKSQAEMYNIEYSDLQQVFKNANIDDQWLPTNYADVIISKLDWKTTTQSTKQVSWLNLLKSSLNNMSSNIKLSSNTKTTLQSKYWINN